MSRFENLLLDVWREACRHAEIGDSVALHAPELFRQLPLDVLMVRRIDFERSSIETVATGLGRPGPDPARHLDPLTGSQLERLIGWCRRSQIMHAGADRDDELA